MEEMQDQVKKEMDEDKEIYKKVKCWCNNNEYEKKLAVEAAEKVVAVGKDSADSVVEKVGKAAVALAEVAGVVVRVKTHSQRYPPRRT